SSRRRHTRWPRDWSSDVCSSDLNCFCLSALDEFYQPNEGRTENVRSRPVGTRGGREEGWGPCACPGRTTMHEGLWMPRQMRYLRSEERRVGKEWRARWGQSQ